MRKINLLLLALLLTACNLPLSADRQGVPPATDTPDYHQCGFQWATKNLPDLSEQVQTAMAKAGLKDITVRAEAYGENCLDSQSNEIVSFAALETDFHISAKVADLTDAEALGNLAERILIVLDQFPVGSTPGPQPGSVGIRFMAGDQDLNVWFTVQEGKAAREAGLHGQALLERLQKK